MKVKTSSVFDILSQLRRYYQRIITEKTAKIFPLQRKINLSTAYLRRIIRIFTTNTSTNKHQSLILNKLFGRNINYELVDFFFNAKPFRSSCPLRLTKT
jgi:hypothetical protein